MKQEIVNCLTYLATRVAEGHSYRNWSDSFARTEVDGAISEFYEELQEHIDFSALTADEMNELRFGRWDDKTDLWLFPLWITPIIPDDMNVYGIGGGVMKAVDAKKVLDIRFGCVAWGIYPADKKA